VTEVPDETAHGDHLALTSRAHLLADGVLLRLLADSGPAIERTATRHDDGRITIRLRRRRPLV
jgi:hypothetical protein